MPSTELSSVRSVAPKVDQQSTRTSSGRGTAITIAVSDGKSSGRPAMPVIKPALHHVTFKTSRLDEMIAWYGTVLGGTINFKDDHNAWMTNDEANHRFAFLSVPGLEDDPDKVKHNVMHHSALESERYSDLMYSYARRQDQSSV